MTTVHGPVVDDATRCLHYASPLDIVAIEFACCRKFYPCYQCHDECETHERQTWPTDRLDAPALLCGVCRSLIAIEEYLQVSACPHCAAEFNPRCKLHRELYFDS